MQQMTENLVPLPNDDASLIARIVSMRESVRRNKQRALEVWSAACATAPEPVQERTSVGRFTEQLVKA